MAAPSGRAGELEAGGEQQHEGHDPRVARSVDVEGVKKWGPAQETPEQQDEHRRSGGCENRPLDEVSRSPVPELVCEDQAKLRLPAVLEERVEEDEPPGTTEAGHVCVLLRRPAAGVRDKHVLDRDARVGRELPQRTAELLVLERREPVEERLQDRRSDKDQEDDEGGSGTRSRERPRVGESARERDQAKQRRPSEHDGDAEPLRPVRDPAARGLRREAPGALSQVAGPEGKRQRRNPRDDECDRKDRECL